MDVTVLGLESLQFLGLLVYVKMELGGHTGDIHVLLLLLVGKLLEFLLVFLGFARDFVLFLSD